MWRTTVENILGMIEKARTRDGIETEIGKAKWTGTGAESSKPEAAKRGWSTAMLA
jgi:hypothetical protein